MRDSIAYNALPISYDAYVQYIDMYPQSKWVPTIKKNLETMAYNDAKKANTINAYAKFIGNYPNNQKAVREFEELILKKQGAISWLISPKYKDIKMVTDSSTMKSYYLFNT